ncbi:hypothetical protein ACR6A7_21070 [Pantoea sp. RRHST58]|uniref:hypothetical protein n=1 Tax=Pantoea sp. RRHST58 TaxID=3425183 RepID=UPI003DA0EBE9
MLDADGKPVAGAAGVWLGAVSIVPEDAAPNVPPVDASIEECIERRSEVSVDLIKYVKWRRVVVGQELSKVIGLIFILKVPCFEHPQRLQFIFDGVKGGENFKCGGDGASLELTSSPLLESDLGEYGNEEILDISANEPFYECIGRKLAGLHLIFSSVEDANIGVRFNFEGGEGFCVVNWGDEINIMKCLPDAFEKNEGIKYKVI